jgi:DNA mismatch repair protein MutL
MEMASMFKSANPREPSGRPLTRHNEWPGEPPSHPPTGSKRAPWGPLTPTRTDPEQLWRSLYGPPREQAADAESIFGTAPYPSGGPANPAPSSGDQLSASARDERPRAIQMHNLYLVVETEEGIVIVDQHALHERVIYEQLRQRITLGPLESQRLLLPETLRVTPQQAALVESNAELLHTLGIEVTPFGPDALAIHGFPGLLKDTDVVAFMRDLLDRLAQQAASTSSEAVVHSILDMMACKAAVKAGDALSEPEIEALIRQRHLIEKPSSCPHGRPTMLRLTKADLNRQFKRT